MQRQDGPRSVGSLNSLQHMRGTRGSSALGRINGYLGGDAQRRRRGRGMMTCTNRGEETHSRIAFAIKECAAHLDAAKHTKHTFPIKNNWPPEALPEIPDVSWRGRPPWPRRSGTRIDRYSAKSTISETRDEDHQQMLVIWRGVESPLLRARKRLVEMNGFREKRL